MIERWKDIPGYDGKYQASTEGNIRRTLKSEKNFLSRQAITDRCNGKTKRGPAPDGYEYAWDNSEASRRKAIRRLELAGGYTPMPTAPAVEFEF